MRFWSPVINNFTHFEGNRLPFRSSFFFFFHVFSIDKPTIAPIYVVQTCSRDLEAFPNAFLEYYIRCFPLEWSRHHRDSDSRLLSLERERWYADVNTNPYLKNCTVPNALEKILCCAHQRFSHFIISSSFTIVVLKRGLAQSTELSRVWG